jgi:hypothetical protein
VNLTIRAAAVVTMRGQRRDANTSRNRNQLADSKKFTTEAELDQASKANVERWVSAHMVPVRHWPCSRCTLDLTTRFTGSWNFFLRVSRHTSTRQDHYLQAYQQGEEPGLEPSYSRERHPYREQEGGELISPLVCSMTDAISQASNGELYMIDGSILLDLD